MKSARIFTALAALLALSGLSGQATAQPKKPEMVAADRLFKLGQFAEAGELYSRIVQIDPKDYSAILRLGRITLLSNRLGDAEKWLQKAINLEPSNTDAKVIACRGVLST